MFCNLLLTVSDYRKEFRRHFQYDYTIQSTPYDYRSILHFSENAYDVRPNNDLSYTLTNVFDRNEPLGGTVLTKYNILAINKLYHCGEFYRGNWETFVGLLPLKMLVTF